MVTGPAGRSLRSPDPSLLLTLLGVDSVLETPTGAKGSLLTALDRGCLRIMEGAKVVVPVVRVGRRLVILISSETPSVSSETIDSDEFLAPELLLL